MPTKPLSICAFDIKSDGSAQNSPHIDGPVSDDFAYRWIHFDLTSEGLDEWCAQELPAFAASTLLAAKTRPRVDDHDDGLVLTLRGINLNDGAEVEDMVSLRLWITPRLVVSVRKMRVFAMDELRHEVAAGNAPITPGHMIARITEKLVDRIEKVSLDIEDSADHLEETVYDHGQNNVTGLAPLRRSVIKLRRHIGPMNDALNYLAQLNIPLIPKKLRPRLRDTANRATRSVEEVHEIADRLTALNQHLDLRNDTRLARNSYILSVIAAIFLPLGFLTGLFGVNVGGMPLMNNPHGFIILCAAMIIIGLGGYLFLRVIKWF